MARRLIAGAALAAAAALTAAGCGGDGKPADGPEVAWAGKACGLLTQGAPLPVPKIEQANVVQSKKSLVTLLGGISGRLGTLETNLKGLGAPPVDGGAAAYGTALTRLGRTRAAVDTATGNLKRAKVTDAPSLKGAMGDLGKAFQQYNGYQGPEQDLRANPALAKAFDKAPACQSGKG